jgi:putative endonuclease
MPWNWVVAASSSEPSHRGQHAERLAETFLNQQGLRTIARNHRSHRGELDLVMCDERSEPATLAFVEVRQRQRGHTSALDSIDGRKQRRLISAARDFLVRHPLWSEHACRFDVITLSSEHEPPSWIPSAFEPEI